MRVRMQRILLSGKDQPAVVSFAAMRKSKIKLLAAAGCSVTLLAACGSDPPLNPTATAKYLVNAVVQKTGFRPVDMQCPSGVSATVGGRFKCHFTGPEGPYTAYMRILKVKGQRVDFQFKTQPSSWPAPTLK